MEYVEHGRPESERANVHRSSAAGGADELIQALTHYRRGLVRRASQLIRSLNVDEADLDAEGAVDLAFCALHRRAAERGDNAAENQQDLVKRAWGAVRLVILQHKRRSRSVKRGGDGRDGEGSDPSRPCSRDTASAASRGFRRVEADLDRFASHEPAFEEVVDAKIDLEALAERIHHDRLRTILTMHHQGHSITEIAAALGLHRHTVARKMRQIAQICARPRARP